MKVFSYILFISLAITLPATVFSQSHKLKCDIGVEKIYSQKTLDHNIGYYVVFKNNSNKTVDAIEWDAMFYNRFGDFKGKSEDHWASSNIFKPASPGSTIEDLKPNWIGGADDVYITIKRVHYTDGSICK